jgi:hypothetical protein
MRIKHAVSPIRRAPAQPSGQNCCDQYIAVRPHAEGRLGSFR